jgi:hypothetical protein
MSTNGTLTLKTKSTCLPEHELTPETAKPKKPKGPHYWHPFMDGVTVCIDMQSGVTWKGKLIAVHNYELRLDEQDHGPMMILKEGVECVRLATTEGDKS